MNAAKCPVGYVVVEAVQPNELVTCS